MAETVFINQEEADFHAKRRRPAFEQAAFTLQQLTLFVIEPGLMANPDIQVRRTALSYR
ncbi:hypothetical protein D3C72_2009160 [compost metagenome]